MAVGFQFLTKTAGLTSGLKAGSANHANNTNNNASIHSSNSSTKSAGNNAIDMASMSTTDLINHVYDNNPTAKNGENVSSTDHSGEDKTKPDNIKLPLTVEYGDGKFATHGKKFEDLVQDIAKQTGDSTCKVESELKRKYTSVTGGKLNMSA